MDPNEALEWAQDAIRRARDAGSTETRRSFLNVATVHLDDYADWRRRGGFEPPDGDALHGYLVSLCTRGVTDGS